MKTWVKILILILSLVLGFILGYNYSKNKYNKTDIIIKQIDSIEYNIKQIDSIEYRIKIRDSIIYKIKTKYNEEIDKNKYISDTNAIKLFYKLINE